MPRRRATASHGATAQVVNLSEVRLDRRLLLYRLKIDHVLRSNRRAIGRLYTTGALFTKVGTRAGRDLLTAHEHLLRVVGLIERLSHQGDVPPPRKPAEVDAVFLELDTLLQRTAELTEQTGELLGELKKE